MEREMEMEMEMEVEPRNGAHRSSVLRAPR
jgi:hypothetical protein